MYHENNFALYPNQILWDRVKNGSISEEHVDEYGRLIQQSPLFNIKELIKKYENTLRQIEMNSNDEQNVTPRGRSRHNQPITNSSQNLRKLPIEFISEFHIDQKENTNTSHSVDSFCNADSIKMRVAILEREISHIRSCLSSFGICVPRDPYSK